MHNSIFYDILFLGLKEIFLFGFYISQTKSFIYLLFNDFVCECVVINIHFPLSGLFFISQNTLFSLYKEEPL